MYERGRDRYIASRETNEWAGDCYDEDVDDEIAFKLYFGFRHNLKRFHSLR